MSGCLLQIKLAVNDKISSIIFFKKTVTYWNVRFHKDECSGGKNKPRERYHTASKHTSVEHVTAVLEFCNREACHASSGIYSRFSRRLRVNLRF